MKLNDLHIRIYAYSGLLAMVAYLCYLAAISRYHMTKLVNYLLAGDINLLVLQQGEVDVHNIMVRYISLNLLDVFYPEIAAVLIIVLCLLLLRQRPPEP